MIPWLDSLSAALLVFLIGLAAALGIMLAGLIVWRTGGSVIQARRRRLAERYQPLVDALIDPAGPPNAPERLAQVPHRHRMLISGLLLRVLRSTTGATVPRIVGAAASLGIVDRWVRGLHDRRWWVRADAAHSLGFLRSTAHVDQLLALLDDPHEEVRAAAVDALGRIGDARAIGPLVARLPEESRHQRARLVEALRELGQSVAATLVDYATAHPQHTVLVIDVLGASGAVSAVAPLLAWTGAPQADVRAAAVRAIGSIGIDDRSFYYVLRSLDDLDPGVRAMAARALGRSGRRGAAPYLGAHLADEWLVAAHSAAGLRRLGAAGRTELETQRAAPGIAGVLARQMLWEIDRAAVGR